LISSDFVDNSFKLNSFQDEYQKSCIVNVLGLGKKIIEKWLNCKPSFYHLSAIDVVHARHGAGLTCSGCAGLWYSI